MVVIMKILGISGSPRKNGNTEALLKIILDRLQSSKIDVELITVADHRIDPCIACRTCRDTKTCQNTDDDFLMIYQKMVESDGFILGSPTWYGFATPQLVSLMVRAGSLAFANTRAFKRKIGGAVAVARRAGHNATFAQILMFFGINGMIIPGSTYWNVALANKRGEISQDVEAIETAKNFADEFIWVLQKLHSPSMIS